MVKYLPHKYSDLENMTHRAPNIAEIIGRKGLVFIRKECEYDPPIISIAEVLHRSSDDTFWRVSYEVSETHDKHGLIDNVYKCEQVIPKQERRIRYVAV